MVSCVRFFVVLIPLIFSIAALVLGAFACAGSTKDMTPVDQIYMLRMNITDIDVSSVFGSSVSASISASDLGLSDIYSIGMWGYCKGDNDNGDYNVTYCSKPTPMFLFDPVSILTEDLSTSISSSDLNLPDKVEDYIKTAKIVSKVIFITTIIGVVAAFVVAVLTLLSFCSHFVSCVATILSIITFLALGIAAAASTAAYTIVKKYFNDALDDYGISATLSNYRFYGLIWAAFVAALITAVFSLFAICCGRTSSKTKVVEVEKEPFMGYEERHVV